MGIKLGALEEGSPIVLDIRTKDKGLRIEGSIKKILKEDAALVVLDLPVEQRIKFENVHISVEYTGEEASPIIWKGARIVYYQGDYVMQVSGEGVAVNRRDCFRVGVSHKAMMRIPGETAREVIVRDVSISGFALTDRGNELNLKVGQELSISFEDIGHVLNLSGRVVRTQPEPDNVTIYGLEITNICRDLASYISIKQRNNRNK